MTSTDAPGAISGKPLIVSERVEGTTVYDPTGRQIGTIKRLMIETMSGKVSYAVMSFGGVLAIGKQEHTLPWGKLTYDTGWVGYRTDMTAEQLRGGALDLLRCEVLASSLPIAIRGRATAVTGST